MMNLLRVCLRKCLSSPSSTKALAVAAALILSEGRASATQPGNVVHDTYFLNAQKPGPFTTISSGQVFGSWNVTQGNVDLNTTYFTAPTEGTNTVDLNGLTSGGISQVVETVPGKTYTLRFKVSGNWETTSDNRTFKVTAGPLSKSLAVVKPVGWSKTNMKWKALSYPFIATSTSTTITFTSLSPGFGGAVIAEVTLAAPVEAPKALDSIPVPLPSDLDKYVANKDAAIALGKALFWDMQTGGDGKTACATCHWHAGADARTVNTLNPGAPGSTFGHQTSAGPALAADALAKFPGVNLRLQPDDFPYHRLRDMDQPASDSNAVIFDTKRVTGSQGVISKKFLNIVPGNPVDNGQTTVHPVFNLNGTNVRQVTGRNAPTMINAVYHDRTFWDGRANRYFNGVNPFGNLDSNAKVLKSNIGTKTTTTVTGYKWVWKWSGWWGYWSYEPQTVTKTETVDSLDPVSILIDNASLASQAVGPPNNDVEMSWSGREFRELARKMFSLRPLAQQDISSNDSVLGIYADGSGKGLNSANSYASFIRTAFKPEWWNSTKTTADGYTHMEANFSMFWGLSIMLYESTLVSGDTPFDRYRKGDDGALSDSAKRGLKIFLNEGKCINCHHGPEFAGATISHLRGVLGDDGPVELMPMAKGVAFYDGGFYNIGVRQTEEDIGVGASHPQFGPLSYSKQTQNGKNVGSKVSVPAGARTAVNGAFKAPTLRNIELTGPYFHNGGQKDLLGVVKFYTRGADFKKTNIQDLDPDVDGISELQGNEQAQLDLVEFMKHLTDERVKYRKAPFDHPQLIIPNGHTGVENGVALDNNIDLPAVGRDGGDPFMPFEEALTNGY